LRRSNDCPDANVGSNALVPDRSEQEKAPQSRGFFFV